MSNWIYSEPVFECDKLNFDLLSYAPWSGHRAFVYDFMRYFKPESVVELGSHYGCSAFTFCQADKDFALGMDMYFVDTWQGDDFTKKYDNDVYTVFSKTVESFYSQQRVNMLRMTFDEAAQRFGDKSIDLLHIDGSHHYDDVKRDFETWLPKVKDSGVIMLHDVSSDIVLGGIMGSHTYWGELKERFKNCFEFDFSWGLGLIFLSDEMYADFKAAVKPERYQRYNNALDVDFKDRLRKNYFELKDSHIYIDDLLKQKDVLNTHLEAYKKDTAEKEGYIESLNGQIKELTSAFEAERKAAEKSYEADRQNTIAAYEENMAATRAAYEKTIEDMKNGYESTAAGKDSYIKELEERVSRLNGELSEKTAAADAYRTMYENTLTAKAKGLYHRISGKKGEN